MRSLISNATSILSIILVVNKSLGFIHTTSKSKTVPSSFINQKQTLTSTSTSLNAIGVLARKAKEVFIQQWKDSGDVPLDVQEKLNEIISKRDNGFKVNDDDESSELQQALTKRRGTVTVIAEYKRKLDKGGFIDETLDPEILSPRFREFGATAIAVMADERMGGCTYKDLSIVKKEQELARGDMPGPLLVISSDLIIDDIQLAQASVSGADAVLLNVGAIGDIGKCKELFTAAKSIGLDVILGVSDKEQANDAIQSVGGRILCIYGSGDDVDEKGSIIENLDSNICTIGIIYARDNKELEEVEEAWMLRDKGFNSVWASDCLYKYGQDEGEHPGAIIRSMKSKSSLKYASPKALSGKGEGAREYLGDIMM